MTLFKGQEEHVIRAVYCVSNTIYGVSTRDPSAQLATILNIVDKQRCIVKRTDDVLDVLGLHKMIIFKNSLVQDGSARMSVRVTMTQSALKLFGG